jgi:hypothetical protein
VLTGILAGCLLVAACVAVLVPGPATLAANPVLAQPATLAGIMSGPSLSCRSGCAACCTAPSISSAIPGMPDGKPAGVACVQLDPQLRCRLFGKPGRPAFCASLRPGADMCGSSRSEALALLTALETATRP